MSFWQAAKREIHELALAGLFFAAWIGSLMLLKTLILAEYHIEFHQWSLILVGALVLAKVVLVLEHVSLGRWVGERPAWVEVLLRTLLYSAGVFVVLVLEKAFEGRHESGGFGPALSSLFERADAAHVWANTIALSGALLVFNLLSLVRRSVGEGTIAGILLSPPPEPDGGHASEGSPPADTPKQPTREA